MTANKPVTSSSTATNKGIKPFDLSMLTKVSSRFNTYYVGEYAGKHSVAIDLSGKPGETEYGNMSYASIRKADYTPIKGYSFGLSLSIKKGDVVSGFCDNLIPLNSNGYPTKVGNGNIFVTIVPGKYALLQFDPKKGFGSNGTYDGITVATSGFKAICGTMSVKFWVHRACVSEADKEICQKAYDNRWLSKAEYTAKKQAENANTVVTSATTVPTSLPVTPTQPKQAVTTSKDLTDDEILAKWSQYPTLTLEQVEQVLRRNSK